MFDWINFDDQIQVHWAKVYIKRITSVVYYDELDDEKKWPSIIAEKKIGKYHSKSPEEVVKAMRAAWRKKKSKANRKFNAAPDAKKEIPLSLTNKANDILEELAKKHSVTKSHYVECLILGEDIK